MHPLGGSMCRPYRSIYPQRQRRLVNRLYGSHHDRPHFQLARNVELPTITRVMTKKVNGKERTIEEEIFDKSSDRIARLVTKSGCVDTRDVAI